MGIQWLTNRWLSGSDEDEDQPARRSPSNNGSGTAEDKEPRTRGSYRKRGYKRKG
jgi:hypothetical protein